MATRSEEFFHDKWLGMVQTESEGLVVAKPVLIEAGCANTQATEVQEKLRKLCPPGPNGAPRSILDLAQFFNQLLDLDSSLLDKSSEIAHEVSLYAPEGPQTVRPSFGLLRQDKSELHEGVRSAASNAADKYVALIWDFTEIDGETKADAIGFSLDKPETITGPWSYSAAAKFDRLLRHCRVPVGILTNREVIRLVYAPHGESSGHITFRIEDMATVGGRPILDAMIMLLCSNQWFGVSKENSLPSLLKRSREYQGTVTADLAEQVFSGLEALLKGFQTAAERDNSGLLREALELDKDHLYRGLLTVMLRLVFILYAEDRGLLPVDHPHYAKHMSLLGLFERLQREHGIYPDSMNNRFSAWGQIISLSRAIYLGVEHKDFHIPSRQGELFDPHRYSFLEGWSGESAPVVTQAERAEVKVPTIDDGTVFALLRSLLIFQGQRLSYRTLDVEQIGSVYEALMGYHVTACQSPAVAIRLKGKKGSPKYWLEAEAALIRPAGLRVKWLKDECGFDTPVAIKIQEALESARREKPEDKKAVFEALLPLVAGKKVVLHEQLAGVGQYVLQPGSERRRSGTQYTPRALTEPIVRKTLEPLINSLGKDPTASQLLELKVCDHAMGSGAFLVESCRQLADEVVAAWGHAHVVEQIAANCPNGDVVAHARRLVAQRCLYGVDKNAMAVQLAKLSLWLFTLARDLPFTFLDHSFRHGDSLVGLNLEQIRAFHWRSEKQLGFIDVEIKRALDEVVAIRQEIHQYAGDSTPDGQKLKAQRLFDASDSTEKVRRIADVCIGAFFSNVNDKARLAQRQLREDVVRAWLEGDTESSKLVDNWVAEIRALHPPFHWWLEFPEVFHQDRSDPLNNGAVNGAACMDGFVGNPPYQGVAFLTDSAGSSYVPWLKALHVGTTGKFDLSAHFFRRAATLCGDRGAMGLISTNTIAQGDTRETGLKYLIGKSWRIYCAERSRPWPGDADVTVSVVHCELRIGRSEQVYLDNSEVPIINSRLRPTPERPDPVPLSVNAGAAYMGNNILGKGFMLSPEQAKNLIAQDDKNSKIILPLLGASEINTSPNMEFDRYVIDFGNLSLEQAMKWPNLLDILRKNVKPERDTNNRKIYREKWWRFAEPQLALREALIPLDRCLVAAIHAKYLIFSFQPANRIFTHGVYVFPINTYTGFAILQSRIHVEWAWLLSSTIRNAGIRYAASDCFDTFPFPQPAPLTNITNIEIAGAAVDFARAKFMSETKLGLTETYNRVNDPDSDDERIIELRNLHEIMDQEVLDAYGWTDIKVPPYCPMNSKEQEAVEIFCNEIIDRLYILNSLRAKEDNQNRKKTVLLRKNTALDSSNSVAGASMFLPGMSLANGDGSEVDD